MTRHLAGMLSRALLLALALVVAAPTAQAAKESRYASIVVDADNGNVLYAVNPDRRSYPASLTKVMTLYLLFDALDQGKLTLNSRLPVSAHATRQSPSKLNLRVGERIDVEDAVLSLVTKSANDVAVVVAEALGGSEDDFADMMTRKARQLGMAATTYRNASGLPDPGQVSTPRDQATLARALIKHHAKYYHYFSTQQFRWKGQPISTHNRLMLRYQGADGIKTGYINASGFNLIASAKRDGKRIVGVVFGGDTSGWRDRNMAQILD
ncbi:MAG: D-alanyl-D-alanine carboxypeptidase, partial [Magnetospirillum sp.]|nr:D-alanyl-D-alanine carboxypeptidase [Magnetospirillum sp.]